VTSPHKGIGVSIPHSGVGVSGLTGLIGTAGGKVTRASLTALTLPVVGLVAKPSKSAVVRVRGRLIVPTSVGSISEIVDTEGIKKR
jgi:hypothetical protein